MRNKEPKRITIYYVENDAMKTKTFATEEEADDFIEKIRARKIVRECQGDTHGLDNR